MTVAACLLLVSSALATADRVVYETLRDPRGPWVIHVVRAPKQAARFTLQSVHADARSVGLETVANQIRRLERAVAAINGDFYERAGIYAGDPRGLQIVDGEMISAPSGSPSIWIDAAGQPRLAETEGPVQVTCGDWKSVVGLNCYRETNGIVLYTLALGPSTRTMGGTEIILSQSLPLRPGKLFGAQVVEIRQGGDSPLSRETAVLSLGPALSLPPCFREGAEVVIATMTIPHLRGAKTAISGGPILVRGGKRQRIRAPAKDTYEYSTMTERHPRSGIGWNEDHYIFVTVDGRQKGVSAGMTLEEFAALMARLGCQEALNMDGGGSATLWYDGKVRNYLADRYEREVANALAIVETASTE